MHNSLPGLFFFSPGVAVDAAISAFFLVGQAENLRQLLLDGGDAARVFAAEDALQRLWQLGMKFFCALGVMDDIDGDMRIDVAEQVEIEVDNLADFENIFLAQLAGAGVFDDGDLAIQLVELQIFVNLHGFACGNVVDNNAFGNGADNHVSLLRLGLGDMQELQDKRHADVFAIFHLAEVSGAGVAVDRGGNLVDAGQGVQDREILFGRPEFFGRQNIAVFEANIIGFVKEALALHARHIQDIKLRHGLLEAAHFLKGDVLAFENIFANRFWDTQLLGRDQHKTAAFVAAHGSDQRMNRAAELEVAAAADDHMVHAAFFARDGNHVGERLRGVKMPAVTGIDDRNLHGCGSHIRRAFFGMTHGDDVRETFHGAGRVRDAFALGGRAAVGLGKADDGAAKLQHSRFKAQAGAGGRLIKERCQFFAFAEMGVVRGVVNDVESGGNQLLNFFLGQLPNVK